MRSIKFICAVGMAAMLAVLMLTGCKKEEATISGITISSSAETVKVGSTVTLSYTYEPSDAKPESAVWSSSDQIVASVDQNGVVTGLYEGTATITVKVNDKYTATCTVTVASNMTGITLSAHTLNLKVDSTKVLTVKVEPEGANILHQEWSVSKDDVVVLGPEGYITGYKEGTATVTVKINDQFTDTCRVTVEKNIPPMTGITISSEAKTIKIDSTFNLTYTVEPAEAKVESAVWSSSAETVATVDQNGVVKGIGAGTATITITVNGTFAKTCTVTVEESTPIYTEGSYSGKGIKIGDTWWAPVNCGYDATHTYGSLYQWGRKYGQYFEAGQLDLTDMNKADDTETNKDNFGKYNETDYNWFSGGVDNTLWTENSKSTHDPCPEGWRVPTEAEFEALISQKAWGTSTVGTEEQTGYWFNGSSAASVGTGVFLPAAGYRSHSDGSASNRVSRGDYWSSSVSGNYGRSLYFDSSNALMINFYRAYGYSVRCVQE